MCHFAQKKVEEFKKAISEAMKVLKLKSQKGCKYNACPFKSSIWALARDTMVHVHVTIACTQVLMLFIKFCLVLIWYTGHGGPGSTGNWIFQDGSVTFEDIYRLYKDFFKGRYLYIVTDCCNSGCWVEECARLLDRDGIKCGHSAKYQGVYIKVFAACLPNEPAYDKYYTQCKGVKLHSHRTDRSKTIKFAEHRRLRYKSSAASQTTLGVDFTKSDSSVCLLDREGRCTHRATWPEYVQRLIAWNRSHDYLF